MEVVDVISCGKGSLWLIATSVDDDGSPVVYAANVSLDTSIVLSKATDALILCAADEEGIYTLQDGTITFHKATAVSVPQSLAHLLQQAQRNRIVSCLPNSSLVEQLWHSLREPSESCCCWRDTEFDCIASAGGHHALAKAQSAADLCLYLYTVKSISASTVCYALARTNDPAEALAVACCASWSLESQDVQLRPSQWRAALQPSVQRAEVVPLINNICGAVELALHSGALSALELLSNILDSGVVLFDDVVLEHEDLHHKVREITTALQCFARWSLDVAATQLGLLGAHCGTASKAVKQAQRLPLEAHRVLLRSEAQIVHETVIIK
jgi:hypothetical protein